MKAKVILAPIGVLFGVALVISICCYLTVYFGINNLQSNIPEVGIPGFLFLMLGVIFVISFLPFFVAGIIALGNKGAVGDADQLRTWGAYKYVRNPMYSGLSFSMIGIGLILNSAGIVFAGFLWLLISFVQCKREEKKLILTFGDNYKEYKTGTPMFIPDFSLVLSDLVKRWKR